MNTSYALIGYQYQISLLLLISKMASRDEIIQEFGIENNPKQDQIRDILSQTSMTVFVQIGGERIAVDVSASATVDDVIKGSGAMYLSFKGQPINDVSSSLSDLGIGADAVVNAKFHVSDGLNIECDGGGDTRIVPIGYTDDFEPDRFKLSDFTIKCPPRFSFKRFVVRNSKVQGYYNYPGYHGGWRTTQRPNRKEFNGVGFLTMNDFDQNIMYQTKTALSVQPL